MPTAFTAYIDEAGDEGFGKLRLTGNGQSQWLALGACIVRHANDLLLPQWRNEILERMRHRGEGRDVHFRKLSHEKKVISCRVLAEKPIGVCVVLSNKTSLLDDPKLAIFKRKQHLYNYLVRFLLERITRACAIVARQHGDGECTLKLVFSRRAGTDYASMRDYLELIRDGREVKPVPFRIDFNVLDLDQMRVENHSKWAGLQVADVCTSAFAAGVERNFYGEFEQRYAEILAPKLIRMNNAASPLNFGLTPIPPLHSDYHSGEQQAFFKRICQI